MDELFYEIFKKELQDNPCLFQDALRERLKVQPKSWATIAKQQASPVDIYFPDYLKRQAYLDSRSPMLPNGTRYWDVRRRREKTWVGDCRGHVEIHFRPIYEQAFVLGRRGRSMDVLAFESLFQVKDEKTGMITPFVLNEFQEKYWQQLSNNFWEALPESARRKKRDQVRVTLKLGDDGRYYGQPPWLKLLQGSTLQNSLIFHDYPITLRIEALAKRLDVGPLRQRYTCNRAELHKSLQQDKDLRKMKQRIWAYEEWDFNLNVLGGRGSHMQSIKYALLRRNRQRFRAGLLSIVAMAIINEQVTLPSDYMQWDTRLKDGTIKRIRLGLGSIRFGKSAWVRKRLTEGVFHGQ